MAQDFSVFNDGLRHVTHEVQDVNVTTPEIAKRIVSFLDIMGFKDLVARQSETNIQNRLRDLSTFIAENVGTENGMTFSIFSDSIVIFSKDTSAESFQLLLRTTSNIIKHSIKLGLPIKGAMAMGICTVTQSSKNSFFFGQPIIDAYLLEENIVFYGVVLHHTLEVMAHDIVNRGEKIIFDHPVPLKKGNSCHYVLDWFSEDKASNLDNLRSIRCTVSDSPRRYIDNTIACFNSRQV